MGHNDEIVKYIDNFKKLSSPEKLGQFQPNLAHMHPCVKGIQVYSNKRAVLFSRGDHFEIGNLSLFK